MNDTILAHCNGKSVVNVLSSAGEA